MALPPNFGQAFDLSSLGKPAATPSTLNCGKEVTKENLASEFVELSKSKPVILLCWTSRSPQSLDQLAILDKLNKDDNNVWELGSVDIDRGNETIISVRCYLSLLAKDSGCTPLETKYYNVPEVFSFAEAYSALKDLESFQDAIDC